MSTTSEEPANDSHRIPLSEPTLFGKEWDYVRECLETNWVSSAGPFVERFETEVARYTGTRHAVATVNGTSALHTALLVAGVEANDEVLVPSLTFIASANAVVYSGAHPVFIDADPTSWQMDPNLVEQFLTEGCEWRHSSLWNKKTGRRVSAIMPVHVLGHPADLDPILALAQRFSIAVVEDAAEAMGAEYKGHKVGGLSHIGCFSFNGNKSITSGAGGMLVTNNESYASRARYLTTQAKDDANEYVHHEVGFNYRMSNVLAAIGCAQLEQLDQILAHKRLVAERYSKQLGSLPGVTVFSESDWARSSFWLSAIHIDASDSGINSRQLRKKLAGKGIETRPFWQPLHQSPAFSNVTTVAGGVAAELYRSCLKLPSSYSLSQVDQQRVCNAITESLTQAVRRKGAA